VPVALRCRSPQCALKYIPLPVQNLREPFPSVTAGRRIPNCRLVIKVPDTRENGARIRRGRRQISPPVEGWTLPLRSCSLHAWVAHRSVVRDSRRRVGGGDLCALRGEPDSSKPPACHPANGETAVDRDRGFAVVEARAVYFRLPQTCSPNSCPQMFTQDSLDQHSISRCEVKVSCTVLKGPGNRP